MIHLLEHIVGLCGDKHLSIIGVFVEPQPISYIITYIKTIIKT